MYCCISVVWKGLGLQSFSFGLGEIIDQASERRGLQSRFWLELVAWS